MPLKAGDQIRRRGVDTVGVVVELLSGNFAKVSFPDGLKEVNAADLQSVERPPDDLLAAGVLGDSRLHLARIRALLLEHAYRYDEAAGLSSARVEPAPHQIFVAHRVLQKLLPRMILADEVGLGKTIEAGLVLKELRARQLVDRCLIVVPASLAEQWRTELSRKFNEDFLVVDGATLKLLGKGGKNPWGQVNNAICSLNLASSPKHAEQVVEAGWDLVIFDEAHRVRRTQRSGDASSNQAYRLADELKTVVDGLLLLTATPVQLHQFELFSLIELVEPGLFEGYGDFEEQRLKLPRLNDLMRSVQQWAALSEESRHAVLAENSDLLAGLSAPADFDDVAGREAALDGLADLHPLAGILVRNRKRQIGMVSERRAIRHPVVMTEIEQQLYEDVTAYLNEGYRTATRERNNAVGFLMVTYQKMLTSSSTALRKSFERRIARLQEGRTRALKGITEGELEILGEDDDLAGAVETLAGAQLAEAELDMELGLLKQLVSRLREVRDSKAGVLLDVCGEILGSDAAEKIVIFTQFRDTQSYLAYALKQHGYTVELFHGGLRPDEKEASIQRFRTRSQVLISTEAGGEGRNLQFCHFLINYDLPWNPMRIEQRIGRLDRYGQTKPVAIYNLAYAGTLEERVLDVLEKRIGVFTESVGALDPILGDVERDIARIVMADVEAARVELDQYSRDLGDRVREARAAESTLADFALDRSSLRRDQVTELLGVTPLASPADLRHYIAEFLDEFGGSIHEHPEGGVQISLSPKLASRLRTDQTIYRGAFNPLESLRQEDRDFLAVGHPFIDAAIRYAKGLEGGATGGRRSPGAPAGIHLECVYRVAKRGAQPRASIHRYLVNGQLQVSRPNFAAADLFGKPEDLPVPSWAREGLQAIASEWAADRTAMYDALALSFEGERLERRTRVMRLARHREQRDRELQEQLASWLEERAGGSSPKDRKIMPAQEGRLAKVRDRLVRLTADLEQELERISAETPDIDFELLWSGLVVGE